MASMHGKQKWILALGLGLGMALAPATHAGVVVDGLEDRLKIPKDAEVPTAYGQAHETVLPGKLTVLVWNMYKGQKSTWASDFSQLVRSADLFLAEEAVDTKAMMSQFTATDLSWRMATSFFMSGGTRTGVATGARVEPLWWDWSRSKYLEPVTNTPKMSVYSTYPLETGETLLVVNIHGVLANFNLVNSLEEQLDQAGQVLQSHQGPALVAGDFNTWLSPRLRALKRWATSQNLQHTEFLDDPRKNPLDHVLTRGLVVEAGRVIKEATGSDHLPLVVQIRSERSVQND